MDYNDIQITGTGHIRTLCPECSPKRKKSTEKCLSVDTEKKIWYCHHCNTSGGDNAKQHFAKIIYTPSESGLPANVIEFFSRRGITEKILESNKIGYGKSFADSNGIQFPFYKNGHVVNIKHRTKDKRFRQEKDAEKCFYRYDVIKSAKQLIITEGEVDALSVQTVGFNNVVSIPDGAPSAKAKTYRTKFAFLKDPILEDVEKFILMMDNDEPGKVAEKELARRLGHERCMIATYPEGYKDANEVLIHRGASELKEIIENAKPYPIEGVFSADDLTNQVFDEYRNGIQGGYSTGWHQLDQFYTVRPGEMTIVTGIPSHGKSNFVDALLLNLAVEQNWRTAIFSPENWPVQRHIRTLAEKVLERPFACDKCGVERMNENELKFAINELSKIFKFIAPEEGILSVDFLLNKTKQLITQFGVDGLVLDPWNEIEHSFGNLREDQYLSQKLTDIRRFARRNGIHVWVIAHPTKLKKDEKTGEYKPPTPYDISGGAHWRNKADNMLCVHRPDFERPETKILIDKIRFKEIGKVGECELTYKSVSGNYF